MSLYYGNDNDANYLNDGNSNGDVNSNVNDLKITRIESVSESETMPTVVYSPFSFASKPNFIWTERPPPPKPSEPHSRWWNRPETVSYILSVIRFGLTPKQLVHRSRQNYLQETARRLKETAAEEMANDNFNTQQGSSSSSSSASSSSSSSSPVHQRKRRSPVVNKAHGWGQMFKKKLVRWRLLDSGYSNRIPVEEQRATLTLAFRMWNEVIPLNFVEDITSHVKDVDIHIAFGQGAHQNCAIDFDGNGGDIAHSWYTGNMHFDDDENFKAIYSPSDEGIYLLRVAVHEIGHVLGLNHTEKGYSVMYAIYNQDNSVNSEFELGWDDRKDVQKIYGVCRGAFDTVFDWVRRRPDNRFIFNTYFFRGNRYWMYENHANRTRYGDPLIINREWKGVPNDIDAYVHIWFYNHPVIVDVTYFFKGDYYYMYESMESKVLDGWPKKISEGFGPKPNSTDRIPSSPNSVFFDMRDRNIYFFKGDKVYVYNPRGEGAPSKTGCCERIVNIRDEFPAAEGQRPLPDNLDAVYYSYKKQSMYFIKGEDVWKNINFSRRQNPRKNTIRYEGKWYEHWYDICDVKSDTSAVSSMVNYSGD
ncbi:matrix metalloproteinase-21-like [Argonauta hians]